mgnify:CR=1 FL=1
MRNYGLTAVLAGKATPAKKKSVQTKLEKLIAFSKGKVGKIDDWGRIDFAYPIAKNGSGHFLHFHLELEPAKTKELDSKLKLEEEIIRYLIVRE